MRDRFTALGRRGIDGWNSFSPGQKAVTIFAILALAIGGYFFASWSGQPAMAPLFSNLAAADASAIVDKLNADGVTYSLSDGGGTADEVIAAARAAGLGFVVISDHNNLDAKPLEGYRDGVLVLVGAIDGKPMQVWGPPLIMPRKSVAGSVIGGLKETQEMVEFCAVHGIAADIELIDGKRLDEAYRRVKAKDVRYRFVIDLKASV